jgi:polyisoprenoid-binding protein YceI
MKLPVSNANRLLSGVITSLLVVLVAVPWMSALSASEGPRPAIKQDPPNQDKYSIDNSHTSIVFAVSHFGLSYTYGRFNQCSGEFALDGGELSTGGFQFKIDANSLDTNDDARDKHLRGPDFFDTQQFPEIKFVTTGFKKVGEQYQVTGEITMLGQTKPLTMPIRVVGIGTGPFGKQRAGFFTKFTIKRSDFGMDKMAGQIGDNISVTFSFEGIKQ